MGYMNGYGYGNSISGFIGGLLVFFVKLLMIVLVVALIAGIIIWIKNNFFKDGFKESSKKITQSQVVQTINNDPVLKMVSALLLVIIGVVLIFSLFNGFSQNGMGYGMNGYMGGPGVNGYGYMNGMNGTVNVSFGQNASYGITALLLIVAKLLMWVLIIALILAALVYIKSQYDSGKFNMMKNKNQEPANPPTIDVQPTNQQ